MKKVETIDDYIKAWPQEIRERLESIRRLVRRLAPDAQEKISYQMPTFDLDGNLVHFAAFKCHIGLFPTPSGVSAFEKELAGYEHAKGSIRFPLDEPLPLKLIEKIVRFRVKEKRAARVQAKTKRAAT
jgi:uncharacterized protein YdhG (YjbR/CyaY superfamily)